VASRVRWVWDFRGCWWCWKTPWFGCRFESFTSKRVVPFVNEKNSLRALGVVSEVLRARREDFETFCKKKLPTFFFAKAALRGFHNPGNGVVVSSIFCSLHHLTGDYISAEPRPILETNFAPRWRPSPNHRFFFLPRKRNEWFSGGAPPPPLTINKSHSSSPNPTIGVSDPSKWRFLRDQGPRTQKMGAPPPKPGEL